MKIVVCVKRVPDTATKIKIGASGTAIDSNDVEYIVSPYDEMAVEHAVQIKEKKDGVEVVALSMGPEGCEKVLRHCLAMGADCGIHIQAETEHDPYVTAKAIATALKEENPDLVLFGVKAVDDDNGQVGNIVASLMDLPMIWGVAELEVEEKEVKVQSEAEGASLSTTAPLPCVISTGKGSIEPRICSLINIRKARKKEIKNITPELTAETLAIQKLELPPQRVGGRIVGKGPEAVSELFRLLREEAKVL